MSTRRCAVLSIGFVSALVLVSGIFAATRRERPIKNPKLDPTAKRVEFYAAIQDGTLEATMIPHDSLKGNLLLANKTKEPMTVKLPSSFVGVQVLKQFGTSSFGGGGLGGGLGGGGLGGFGGGGGQSVGGGSSGGGASGGSESEGGGGEFSIPPEKIVLKTYKSVCLEHGKKEPSSRMRYQVVPTDKYTESPELQELLKLIPRLDPGVAQAAAWHLANKMSWQQLVAKRIPHLAGRPATPYFAPAQVYRAQQLVAALQAKVKEQSADKPSKTQTDSPRASRRRVR